MTTRIQRKRSKGWRMPKGAVYVGRPTAYGNPWTRSGAEAMGFFKPECIPQINVDEFRRWLTNPIPDNPMHKRLAERRRRLLFRLPSLKDKELVCWCPLDQPCHADVLIGLLDGEVRP